MKLRKLLNNNGFTLIELIVVMVIIMILAGLVVPVGQKAIDLAHSSRCKNYLKNLQAAVMNYGNDHGGSLPRAGCYEQLTGIERTYKEFRGWIDWQGDGEWPNEDPQFKKMDYVSVYGEDARTSIEEGTLFDYVSKGLAAYACPAAARQIEGLLAKDDIDEKVYRTYVMSEFFRSAHSLGIYARSMMKIPTIESFPSRGNSDKLPNSSSRPNDSWVRNKFATSRLLLFTEMAVQTEQEGTQAKFALFEDVEDGTTSDKPIAFDSVLYAGVKWAKTYDGRSGSKNVATPPDLLMEAVGMIHGSHGNAVFLDGHVEGLTADQTWWAVNARGREEVAEEVRQR